jgi:hypothetical protein
LYSVGSFDFRVSSPGTRQYRVLIANRSSLSSAYFGGATAPVTTTTAHKPYTARFYTPTVRRGQTAVAELGVAPAFSGKVSLQRWNGKTWTGVKDVAINQGYAKGTFPANLLGRVAYRYYVPARTWKGLVVAAAYSPNFVLTTIR